MQTEDTYSRFLTSMGVFVRGCEMGMVLMTMLITTKAHRPSHHNDCEATLIVTSVASGN